jgi:PAS domain S-box-containing protein
LKKVIPDIDASNGVGEKQFGPGGAETQRQEALLKTGALQDAIFNSAYFSSIATDEKGVIQIFNVGAERMLGYAAADVLNKITPADISDPPELVARAQALSLEMATPITPGFEALVFKASRGIEDIYELTYIRKDGSRFPAIVSVTALRDVHEGIIGYLLIGTDNTARKQVEAARALLDQRLRDQQFYTRSLIESNIDALMMTDPQGIISDVNRQMMALTGRTRDELIGAPCKNFFTDPARAEAAIKRVLVDNKLSDYELTVRALNGEETVVSYNAATFHDRDRKLQGVFAAARDITERKRFERTLQTANEYLEAFSYSVSHDLRAPLGAIEGFSGLLDKEIGSIAATERAIHYIARIRAGVRQMGDLIDGMLSLAQVSGTPLQSEPVDLSAMAQMIVDGYRERDPGRVVQFDSQPGLVAQGDRRLLQQVLDNLLGNAWKFSCQQPETRISFRCDSAADGASVYGVIDNGAGFDMAYADKLFGAFRRLHSVSEFPGTGIGLATVRRIVTRHGGKTWAESAPGQGAAFYFTLGQPPGLPVSTSEHCAAFR